MRRPPVPPACRAVLPAATLSEQESLSLVSPQTTMGPSMELPPPSSPAAANNV